MPMAGSRVCHAVAVIRGVQHVQELSAQGFCCHFSRRELCCTQSSQYARPKCTVAGLESLGTLALPQQNAGCSTAAVPVETQLCFRTLRSVSSISGATALLMGPQMLF